MSDRTTSTASRENRARDELTVLLATAESRREQFLALLPSEIPWDTFKDTFKIAIQSNSRLLEADRQSLWIALQKAAMDGLKPDGREGALVIFGDDTEDEQGNRVATTANKPKRVQWMPMVWGLVKLVRNTGNIANIRTKLIYKGERVEIVDADGQESYRHVRTIEAASEITDDPANIIGAYAVVNYKDGSWEMEPMSRAQIDRVRAVSRAKKGPWQPWFDEMARKTVLRRLIKRLDKSPVRRIEAALDRDDTLTIDATAEPQRALAAPKVATASPDRPAPDPDTRIAGGPAPQEDSGDRQPIRGDVNNTRGAETGNGVGSTSSDARHSPDDDGSEASATGRGVPPLPATPAGDAIATAALSANGVTSPGGEQPGTAFFPTDDTGEPADIGLPDGAFTDPGGFAGWLASSMVLTQRPDALWENNLDEIEKLKVARPDLGALALEAYQAARDRLEAAQRKPTGGAAQQPEAPHASPQPGADADLPPPVPVPTSGSGKPDLKRYIAACRDAIKALATHAALTAWANANFSNYQSSPAASASIAGMLQQRRQEIDEAKRTEAQARQEPPAATDAPARTRDDQQADDFLVGIAGLKSLNDHGIYMQGGALTTKLARWKDERPDLHQRVTEAGAAKLAELRGGR